MWTGRGSKNPNLIADFIYGNLQDSCLLATGCRNELSIRQAGIPIDSSDIHAGGCQEAQRGIYSSQFPIWQINKHGDLAMMNWLWLHTECRSGFTLIQCRVTSANLSSGGKRLVIPLVEYPSTIIVP